MIATLHRQARLVDYTVLALGRRRARSLALVAVYALVVFVLGSVMLFASALEREAAAILRESPEVLVQKLVAGRHALATAKDVAALEGLRGVTAVTGRSWGYFYDPVVAANYTVMVPAGEPPPAGQVIVGDGVARARGLGAGNPLPLRSPAGALHVYTVLRVLSDASSLVSADLVLMNDGDYRRFFDLPPDAYTDIALSVANPQEVRTVAAKVAARVPGSRVILREEILRTYATLFSWRAGLLLAVGSLALLAFVILAWTKAAGLSADETWEGLLVSGGAFVAGYVAAHVHVFHFGAPLIAPVLKGWATLYPRFALAPAVDGLQLLTLALLAVVPYTVATLVPSWRAAIADPAAAMRGS